MIDMIYTIILDHEKSRKHTENLVNNIKDHPYDIIDSSKLKTSFTASFNLGIIKGCELDYSHIMICNNDISLTSEDLDNLNYYIDDNVGIFSPSLNSPHTKVMSKIGKESLRNVYWLEFVAPIFHKDVLLDIRFLDDRMSYGWGVEIDYCYRAELAGYKSYLVQDVNIKHYGHQSQESHETYSHEANLEMNHVLREKYGSDWQALLRYPQW